MKDTFSERGGGDRGRPGRYKDFSCLFSAVLSTDVLVRRCLLVIRALSDIAVIIHIFFFFFLVVVCMCVFVSVMVVVNFLVILLVV